MDILITEKAREMLSTHISGENFLRIVITKGGCAGLTYGAEIDQTMKEKEQVVFQTDTIRIVSDEDSRQYLEGLKIDYSDDLISGGLKLTNLKSERTCGCGASFSLAGFPVSQGGNCGTLN